MKILQIDPINYCNLACPLCESNKDNYKGEKMSIEDYINILSQAEGFDELHLFNWGESFLHPDIIQMIKLGSQEGYKVSVHSNLNVSPKLLQSAVENGLNFLSASIDGVTQETYGRYRIMGDLNLALENMELLSKMQHDFPFSVRWQYIVNRFNEHEIGEAREYAHELGVEFLPLPIGLGDDLPDKELPNLEKLITRWTAVNNIYAVREEYGGFFLSAAADPCYFLDSQVTVKPNLNVSPCCMTTKDESDFGNLKDSTLNEIINGEKYQRARKIFDLNSGEGASEEKIVCEDCYVYDNYLNKKKGMPLASFSESDIEKLIANETVAKLLHASQEDRIKKRLDNSLKAYDIFSRKNMPEMPNMQFLQFCSELFFDEKEFSMVEMPAFNLYALGSSGLGMDKAGSDLEFMSYSLTETPGLTDVYLPSLVGMVLALGRKVDPYCAANIFCGRANIIPESTSLVNHLDSKLLQEYAYNIGDDIGLICEPVFCDLFGSILNGKENVAKTARGSKLRVFEHYYPEVASSAICLGEYNIKNRSEKHYNLAKSLVYLNMMNNMESIPFVLRICRYPENVDLLNNFNGEVMKEKIQDYIEGTKEKLLIEHGINDPRKYINNYIKNELKVI
ncbi:MAG: radical SAM/SPASM domain-containing protein [Nanobdellota archaeon]